MVYFDLYVKVEAENIAGAEIVATDYLWVFAVECSGCVKTWDAQFTNTDQVESEKGKSYHNWAKKCQDCLRVLNISFHKDSPLKIDISKKSPSLFATFDFRNCSPVDDTFKPTPGYIVTSTEGSVFKDCELNDEFCEYCEALKETCLISKVESKFERNKVL